MNATEKSAVMLEDEALMIKMFFHTGYTETVLLMKTTSPLSMLLCCTMVCLLAMIQEGSHNARQWINLCFRRAFKKTTELGQFQLCQNPLKLWLLLLVLLLLKKS